MEKFRINDDLFKVAVLNIIKEESESLKDILIPFENKEWTTDLDFLTGMQHLMELLCNRFVHRASLFGQYRTDYTKNAQPNGKRPRQIIMECKESDFNLAWQTLEQDSK